MFNEFFNSVFNNSSNEPEFPGTHEPVSKDLGQLSEVYVQVSDVKKSLCDLQVSKSPGPDELTARLLKELSNEISERFTKIMNLSLQQGFSLLNGKMQISLQFQNLIQKMLSQITEA